MRCQLLVHLLINWRLWEGRKSSITIWFFGVVCLQGDLGFPIQDKPCKPKTDITYGACINTLDYFSQELATLTMGVLSFLTAWLKMFRHVCFSSISRKVLSCFTNFFWLKKIVYCIWSMHQQSLVLFSLHVLVRIY